MRLRNIIGDYNELFDKDFIIPTWPKMKKDITARAFPQASVPDGRPAP